MNIRAKIRCCPPPRMYFSSKINVARSVHSFCCRSTSSGLKLFHFPALLSAAVFRCSICRQHPSARMAWCLPTRVLVPSEHLAANRSCKEHHRRRASHDHAINACCYDSPNSPRTTGVYSKPQYEVWWHQGIAKKWSCKVRKFLA